VSGFSWLDLVELHALACQLDMNSGEASKKQQDK